MKPVPKQAHRSGISAESRRSSECPGPGPEAPGCRAPPSSLPSRRYALPIVAVFVLAVISWLYLRDAEPTYRGRTLSQWLLSGSNPVEQKEQAIAEMGTNALPFLVKWITYERPRKDLRVLGIMIPFPQRIRKTELAEFSVIALRNLGSRAAPAIPDLVSLLKGTNATIAMRALNSIDAMGMEAVPALLDLVTNRQAYPCSSMLRPLGAMRDLGTNGVTVVPALVQCLKSRDPRVVDAAALLLANVGAHLGVTIQTSVIVPALAEATTSSDEQVRAFAVHGLGDLGPGAESSVPALTRALTDLSNWVREEATNALSKVTPETLKANAQKP